MRSEAEIIRYLQRRFPAAGGVRVGIGDDAAVLVGDARRDWVVTTDLLVEGVHFCPDVCPPTAIGWKALARSLSDIAAMGARPRFALVALAVPDATRKAWIKSFFRGLGILAGIHGLQVVGGDITVARQVLADVQVLGQVPRGRAFLRRGARPGDVLVVSGELGLAGLGLACLRRRLLSSETSVIRAIRLHCAPQPRLRLAAALRRRGGPTAVIDLSDGLSTDLHHLCEASRVGARVFVDRIPAVKLTPPLQRRLRTTGLELALHAGEDYELLFTLPRRRAARLPKKLAGVTLTPIGEITRKRRVVLVDVRGRERNLPPRGWDPFRKDS